jgi:hypothetical protein
MHITQARLREVVHYDPETGIFTWLEAHPPVRVGQRAGSLEATGYMRAMILGQRYFLHVVAWFYMTGEWRPRGVDHRNRKPADNRWANLRRATRGQNQINRVLPANGVGLRGVYQSKGGRYRARIRIGERVTHLGTFDTPEEAHTVYVAAAQALHGEFAEHLNRSPAPEASAAP